MPPQTSDRASRDLARGLGAAFGAFLIWGFLPLYFKAVEAVGTLEIMAHRVVWTVVFLGLLAVLLGRGHELWTALASLRQWRVLRLYVVTTLLISFNWTLYVFAILDEKTLHASLGYYINPLVNVILGMIFLSERLNRWQAAAVVLASIGVANQIIVLGQVPWISFGLAFSFGFYALVRKMANFDPIHGLFVETLLMAPVALVFLLWLGASAGGDASFGPVAWGGAGWGPTALLIAAGVITGLPLLLFTYGAQRLPLSMIGLMQYVAPTLQFLLAVLVFAEPFSPAHLVTFALIWTGLALYSGDGLRRSGRAARHRSVSR
ncbi:MAG: EamA family transporter RarD [Inquilinaceae bacterium]